MTADEPVECEDEQVKREDRASPKCNQKTLLVNFVITNNNKMDYFFMESCCFAHFELSRQAAKNTSVKASKSDCFGTGSISSP